jgi:hypothetical protein
MLFAYRTGIPHIQLHVSLQIDLEGREVREAPFELLQVCAAHVVQLFASLVGPLEDGLSASSAG